MQLLVREREVMLVVDGEGLEVHGGHLGPMPMFAASLALCTASVITTYVETAHLDLEGLRIQVRWDYADNPYRMDPIEMSLHVPESFPAERRKALLRAAETCTIHNTLTHPPRLTTDLVTLDMGDEAPHTHHHHQPGD
jgi:uncharacterized OsmC-like protein